MRFRRKHAQRTRNLHGTEYEPKKNKKNIGFTTKKKKRYMDFFLFNAQKNYNNLISV